MKRPASFCLSAVAVLGAAVSLSSCGSGQASANIGPNGRPAVLRYCLTTSMEDPNSAARRLDRISDYLSKTLHVRIEGVRTTAYGAVIEAFRAEKIDVASISPFSYIIATEKTPIEAIAMRGSKGGTPESYTGVLVVAGNSPIHSVDDLIKHAKELTISFVDPDSTSGFLVQNAFFQSRGLEAQRDFKKVVFSMNHPASLMAVKAGKVDVAAAMQRLVNHYISTGKLASSDVRVI